ncbi:MAG: chemotaxis protein CheB [Gaiellaceae bacterium]
MAAEFDVVVVGASAGGVEALRQLAGSLAADYGGAILVVLHTSRESPGVLPGILGRAGPLPADHGKEGEPIVGGRIYVARPDRHLLVADGRIDVSKDPPEQGHRPAIDPLFRSAAAAYGPRTIGIVLSGVLRDGTAGLAAVVAGGGVALVQDPEDALYPMMPRSALAAAPGATAVLAASIGPTLGRLASRPAAGRGLPTGTA